MPTPASAFAFDDNASVEDNLTRFGAHLAQSDAALGPELQHHFAKLLADTHDEEVIRDALFAATEPVATAGASAPATAVAPTAATAPITLPPIPAPPTVSVAITGWLLEGLSIEGFRGVNNETNPLELKFHTDKVNSVSAVNGVGKSSVHDAVRYAITGRLPWLEELPATERDQDYYLNRFHSGRTATIKLRLVAEPTGAKCERCCQVNPAKSKGALPSLKSGNRSRPSGSRISAKAAKGGSADEMALDVERVVDRRVGGEESLG